MYEGILSKEPIKEVVTEAQLKEAAHELKLKLLDLAKGEDSSEELYPLLKAYESNNSDKKLPQEARLQVEAEVTKIAANLKSAHESSVKIEEILDLHNNSGDNRDE